MCSTKLLPEFLFLNSHVGLPLYTQIDEEHFQLLHTVAMEICDSTLNALAPNLHVMPPQLQKKNNLNKIFVRHKVMKSFNI